MEVSNFQKKSVVQVYVSSLLALRGGGECVKFLNKCFTKHLNSSWPLFEMRDRTNINSQWGVLNFQKKSVTKVYGSSLLALRGGGECVTFPNKKCYVILFEWPPNSPLCPCPH